MTLRDENPRYGPGNPDWERDAARERLAEVREARAEEDERWAERVRDGWQRAGIGEDD